MDESEMLARLRTALGPARPVREQRMFGGTCFMLDGHMLGGARLHKDGAARFMFRVGKAQEAEALARPGASEVRMGARRMPGFVYVEAGACDDAALEGWVAMAAAYLATLEPKEKG